MKKTRILWISRHPPVEKQIRDLKNIYGDIEFIQYAGFVKDSNFVVDLINKFKADEIVVVLPLTIIQHLIKKHGIQPIIPEMEEVDQGDYDYEDPGTGKKFRFVRFVRLRDIVLVKDPLSKK